MPHKTSFKSFSSKRRHQNFKLMGSEPLSALLLEKDHPESQSFLVALVIMKVLKIINPFLTSQGLKESIIILTQKK